MRPSACPSIPGVGDRACSRLKALPVGGPSDHGLATHGGCRCLLPWRISFSHFGISLIHGILNVSIV